jgi:riboflavin synthase
VDETLQKTSLKNWKKGDLINIERSLQLGDRLDGHMVQGHVDTLAECIAIKEVEGSWMFEFQYDSKDRNLLVPKGSITINGVSLTLVKAGEQAFSVTIIPYTFHHTNFVNLKPGDQVNIEYDILGKYIQRMLATQQ